jgi:FAD/FMN-containing dehydrogenase
MSEFSHIELSADKKSVRIGTGLDWGQVYGALAPHGLVVVGGRSPMVGKCTHLVQVETNTHVHGTGVAGLLLSSGYAWTSNEVGFAIDNILSAGTSLNVSPIRTRTDHAPDIVLPNGTFTTVSETEGSDIFFALQGGTNNFGIVTSFTLRTFEIGKVWGGTIQYPADQLNAMIDATVEYSAKPSVPKATLATQFFATNGTTAGAASEFPSRPVACPSSNRVSSHVLQRGDPTRRSV